MRSRSRRLRRQRRLGRKAYHRIACMVLNSLRDTCTFLPASAIQQQRIREEIARFQAGVFSIPVKSL